MKKIKVPELFNFRIVMDETRLEKLDSIKYLFDFTDDVKKFIVFLLIKYYLMFEKTHLFKPNQKSKYKLINDDLTVKRVYMKIKLPREIYKRIKLIHQDVNFFSMAQIIRLVLDFVLKLAAVLGYKIHTFHGKLKAKWEERKAYYQNNNLPFRKHIPEERGPLARSWVLKSFYSAEFCPLEIYLL